MKAGDVSRRHGELTQKINSLRIVAKDRQMQLKEMMTIGQRTRPKSSFMRTPKHIVALKSMLADDIESMRQTFEQHSKGKLYSQSDKKRCNGLICNLEKQLADIDLVLVTSFEECIQKYEPVSADDNRHTGQVTSPREETYAKLNVPNIIEAIHEQSQSDSDLSPIHLDTLSSTGTPRLEPIFTQSIKQKRSPIAFNSRPPPKPDVLRSQLMLKSASSESNHSRTLEKKDAAPVPECSPEYRLGLQQSSVLRLAANRQRNAQYISQEQPPTLQKQRTEFIKRTPAAQFRGRYIVKPRVGYPFGSSFPELPPLPQRKWNGKKYVSSVPGSPVMLPSGKTRQVVNIRQNTWLW